MVSRNLLAVFLVVSVCCSQMVRTDDNDLESKAKGSLDKLKDKVTPVLIRVLDTIINIIKEDPDLKQYVSQIEMVKVFLNMPLDGQKALIQPIIERFLGADYKDKIPEPFKTLSGLLF